MKNYEADILERLLKGEDINKIAAEFTASLNSAKNEQERLIKEQEKRDRERETKLNKYAADLLTALRCYITLAYPKAADGLPEEAYDVEAFREILDEGLKSLFVVSGLTNAAGGKTAIFKHPKTADESIDNFIKMFVDR